MYAYFAYFVRLKTIDNQLTGVLLQNDITEVFKEISKSKCLYRYI